MSRRETEFNPIMRQLKLWEAPNPDSPRAGSPRFGRPPQAIFCLKRSAHKVIRNNPMPARTTMFKPKSAKPAPRDGAWRAVDLPSAHARPKAHDENQPAQIFDAGANLIISGYSKARVEEALNKLAESGARIISSATRVSDKWMASCEHPQANANTCKVVTIEGKQIVTGPTREAVSTKVNELVHYGATLVSEIAFSHGVWTAVCQTGER